MDASTLEPIAACAAQLPAAVIADIARTLREAGKIDRLAIHRLLQPSARANFDNVIEAWRVSHDDGQVTELAAALEAAAFQAERLRQLGAIDLVWSGPSMSEDGMRSTEQAIHEVICSARKTLDVVVFAAYKVPLLNGAIADAVRRGVRVRLVLESRAESDGKVNFDAATALSAPGGSTTEMYVWPLENRVRNERGQFGALHAKFVVADGTRLFVSSANLTEFAMNLNLELGVLITGGSEPGRAVAMIDALIRRGTLARLTQ